jgi:hypothetical protein
MGSHQYPSGSSKGVKLKYTLKNKVSHTIFKKCTKGDAFHSNQDTQPAHVHTVL